MLPAIARVRRRHRETAETFTLEIEPEEPGADWAFQPGQFNMLDVFGVGEAAISLSGDPARTKRLLHTVRAVGPVSRAIDGLSKGAAIGLRGPFGNAWPLAAATGADVLIIAGGLGLAPLRPLLYGLLAERRRYGRIVLLYGTRSPADILFRSELEAWRRAGTIQAETTVDHTLEDWNGHVGVVTTLIPRGRFDPRNTIAMICGPEIMMRFAIAALRDAGLAERAIHVSMERNMKCAIGHCGHCQFGPALICRDGPIFSADRVAPLLGIPEL